MSEEILNESTSGEDVVARDGETPILDLTHLDPEVGITQENIITAITEQGINASSNFEVRLPNPSSDGKLVIGDGTFSYLSVTKVRNLNKVTSIGNNAFEQCSSLFGKIWIDSCTNFGSSAFQNCSSIEEVVLSPNLDSIPYSCFYNCGSLQKVYNLNKVTSIGDMAFGYAALSGKIWIDSCTSIGARAFEYCSSIEEVVLNPNIKQIPQNCFHECTSLTKVYNLNKVTSIGDKAFESAALSGKIWIDRCTNLGLGYTFFKCANITEVVLSPNLESIQSSCFGECDSLTKVHNLNKVTSIGNNAFQGCSSLSGKIWIDSCTSLSEYVFNGCGNITEVVLSRSLQRIPSQCFDGCTSLQKVYNLNKVIGIGSYAFQNCNQLSGKIWIDSCEDLGGGSFDSCSNITDIVLLQSLYDYIKDSLTSYAPESVNWIPV